MHWCQDETLAAMSTVPVVGYLFRKLHRLYHEKTHHKCHHDGCEAGHLHHTEEPLMPNPPARQVLTMEEVDAHWGSLATIFLMFDRKLLGIKEFVSPDKFVWFVSEDDTLTARLKNKFYEWDGKEWKMEDWCLPKPPLRTDLTSDNKLICNVENTLELLHSIKRISVEDGYLEAWFDDEEYGSSITSFIPGSFTREVLELLEDHILGINGKGTGSNSQGLDPKQEEDPGPTQQN